MLKRILATALAAAMIFGLASVALAGFSDTAGNANEKGIVKLTSLGLLKGYEDGTFKPAGNITRAEFAAVVVRALGYEASAKLLTGAPAFTDVAGAQWAWGYINVASAQGVIKGYPDGTFRPNANVTIAEAVTMLVRALGRDEQATGIWPTGHIMVASQVGMLPSDLPGVDVAATRGVVATLAANVLDKPFGYKDKETGLWKDGEESFLSRNSATILKGRKVTDVDTDDNTITIEKLTGDATDFETEKDLAAACVFVGGANLAAMKGQKVDILFNDDGEAIYVGATSTVGITGKVTAIDKVNKKITVNGTVYTVLDSATCYYNGKELVGDAVLKITDLVDADVTLVLNSDKKVTYIDATELSKIGIIEKKQSGYASNNLLTIDGTEYTVNSDAGFVRNGVTVAWADLQVGDDAKFAIDGDGHITLVDAYAAKISGTLQERVTTNDHITFKVNDVVYAVYVNDDGDDDFTDDAAAIPGAAITLTLNRDGKITKVALQGTTTAVVTLQSKTSKYDANSNLVYVLTLSDGSVVTVKNSATISRNNLTQTTEAGFLSLKSGDSLLFGDKDPDGKYTELWAFAPVSGYIYRETGDEFAAFSINEYQDGSGDDLAYVTIGDGEVANTSSSSPSTILENGVQKIVTDDTEFVCDTSTALHAIKISSWSVTALKQYANFIKKDYTNITMAVKAIESDGTDTILTLHNGLLSPADKYLKLTSTSDTIIHRSDAVLAASSIGIGDKLSVNVGAEAGTEDDPWIASFIYDSTDTAAPTFSTGYKPHAHDGVARKVYFKVKEDVLVRYKVYKADGTLVYTSSWAEKPRGSEQYVEYNVGDAGAEFTMVLTFKDYGGNTTDPYSVLVQN